MVDEAAADSVTPYKEILALANGIEGLGSIYALGSAKERRQIIKISGEPGNMKSEIIKDFDQITNVIEEIRQYSDKEGTPSPLIREEGDVELAHLDVAWRALAEHFHETEDQASVLKAMRTISNLKHAEAHGCKDFDIAAGNTFTCEYCDRTFANQGAAIQHLANVHAAREKTTKMKTERD